MSGCLKVSNTTAFHAGGVAHFADDRRAADPGRVFLPSGVVNEAPPIQSVPLQTVDVLVPASPRLGADSVPLRSSLGGIWQSYEGSGLHMWRLRRARLVSTIVAEGTVRVTEGLLDFMRALRRFQSSVTGWRGVFNAWRVGEVSLPSTGFADVDAGL
jgi:hypothetical protein